MNETEAVEYLNSLPSEKFTFIQAGSPFRPWYALAMHYGSHEEGVRVQESLEALGIPVERNALENPPSVEMQKADRAALLIEGIPEVFRRTLKGIDEDYMLLMRNPDQLRLLKEAGIQQERMPANFLDAVISPSRFPGGADRGR